MWQYMWGACEVRFCICEVGCACCWHRVNPKEESVNQIFNWWQLQVHCDDKMNDEHSCLHQSAAKLKKCFCSPILRKLSSLCREVLNFRKKQRNLICHSILFAHKHLPAWRMAEDGATKKPWQKYVLAMIVRSVAFGTERAERPIVGQWWFLCI